MSELLRKRGVGYVVAVAGTAAMVLLRAWLDPRLGDELPFVTIFGAVAVAAYAGGILPGVLATALGYVACNIWFIAPREAFEIAGSRGWLGLAAYVLTCAILIVVVESWRRALQRSRETEGRLRVTLASIGDAVITTDAEGRVRMLNAVAESLTGWTSAEARGRPLEDVFRIVREQDGDPAESPVRRVLADGRIVGIANHTLLVARDGSRTPIDDSAAPIRTRDGTILGIVLVFRDVSARRRAEAEQLRSAAHVRSVMESVLDGIVTIDERGTIQSVNPAAERQFGYGAAELVGRNVRMLMPEPHRSGHDDFLGNYLRTGERKVIGIGREVVGRRKDGSTFPMDLAVSEFALGERRYFTGVVRDITARKQAEARLRAGLLVSRTLAEAATLDAAFPRILEELASTLEWDAAVHWALDEGTGALHRAHSWTAPDRADSAPHRDALVRTIPAGTGLPGRVRSVQDAVWIADVRADDPTADGTGSACGFPILVDGRFLGMIELLSARARAPDAEQRNLLRGVGEQIGQWLERRRAEDALRESEERFRLVADAAPVLIWMSGTDKLCTWFNRAWLEFVGRTMEQELGNGWAENVHPDDFDRCLETYVGSFDARRPFSMDYRLRRRDGEWRWILDQGVPRYGPEGRFAGYIGSCIDITARRETESALREADRRKDEFLATLSHELRTPLNAILGWTQILRQHATPEELAQGLEVIERNARAQAQIVSDLLDMGRILRGDLRIELAPLDLREPVDAAIASILPAAAAKGVSVHTDEGSAAATILGDPVRIQQIAWNLLTNAVKFTPRGGEVRVDVRARDGQVELTVSDTGAGIEPAFLPHIFDRFRQQDASRTRSVGGLGLGLSIVQELVELHGGTVRAASSGAGRGSRFVVALPRHGSESAAAGAPRRGLRARETPPCAPDALEGIRVLFVDDEPDTCALVKRLLEGCGAQVRTAESGNAALARLREQRPEVLLCDIGMPDMDGYALIQEVRRSERGTGQAVPAGALTARAGTEDRLRALRSGYQTHIAKPIEARELVASVQSLARTASRGEFPG